MLPGAFAPSKPHATLPQALAPTQAIDTAAQTYETTTSPKTFTVAPGVAAMSRYSMPAPIKSQQQRQHTPEKAKMTASKPASALKISTVIPDTTVATDQAEATEPVTKKQKVDHSVAKPGKGSAVAATSHPTTNNNQPTTVLKDALSGQATSATAQGRLNEIIAGRVLPKSKQEAKVAADEQHNRLLAAYRTQNQSQNNNTRKSARQSIMSTNPDPDFMPHYFSSANFPPSDPNDEDSGSVRCICGTVEDDGESMLECETCQAWQHTDCVFPTLSKAQIEVETDKDYLCTVCDPYAHRHVLKNLRAGQGVGSKQNDKGQGKAKGKAKGKSKK